MTEYNIGDLVEDLQDTGSQGIFCGWGYNGFEQVCGGVETKIAIVKWLKHSDGIPGTTWRIWTNELGVLAKGKKFPSKEQNSECRK